VRAGDWLELADAGELTFVWPLVVEFAPPNDLHGAEGAKRITAEPHRAITARADALNQFEIRVFGMSCASGGIGCEALMIEAAS